MLRAENVLELKRERNVCRLKFTFFANATDPEYTIFSPLWQAFGLENHNLLRHRLHIEHWILV